MPQPEVLPADVGAYVRISGSDATPGSNVFEHTTSPTRFYKSRIAWNPADAAWNLTLKDGSMVRSARARGGGMLLKKWRNAPGQPDG